MLPVQGPGGKTLQTPDRGGSGVTLTTQTIKGVQYGTFEHSEQLRTSPRTGP